jgi:adenosylcobinamide-GDP ribazoletransferase
VGAGLGTLSYVAFRCAQSLGMASAATVSTVLAVLLTGAFHEDGLADSADGLLGAVSRERTLEIMKDRRIGTYGAAALTLVLLLRVTHLCKIGCNGWVALLLSASLARLGPVWLLTHVDHAASSQSKHRDLAGTGRSRAYWAAGSMALMNAALVYAAPEKVMRVGVAWLAAIAVTIYVWRLAQRRLGGITGDLLGACEQLGEVAILGVFAVGA